MRMSNFIHESHCNRIVGSRKGRFSVTGRTLLQEAAGNLPMTELLLSIEWELPNLISFLKPVAVSAAAPSATALRGAEWPADNALYSLRARQLSISR
jgi:hypothetical protein